LYGTAVVVAAAVIPGHLPHHRRVHQKEIFDPPKDEEFVKSRESDLCCWRRKHHLHRHHRHHHHPTKNRGKYALGKGFCFVCVVGGGPATVVVAG
jgi:hypothetical protein